MRKTISYRPLGLLKNPRRCSAVAQPPPLALVYSEDFACDPQGGFNVETLANLALLTGRIGQLHSGIYPLCRYINTQGAADMGMLPSHLTGQMPIADDQRRARLAEGWALQIPAGAGLEFAQLRRPRRRWRPLYSGGIPAGRFGRLAGEFVRSGISPQEHQRACRQPPRLSWSRAAPSRIPNAGFGRCGR
jgi:anaerobic selenocysteine-containing dehydrogenase